MKKQNCYRILNSNGKLKVKKDLGYKQIFFVDLSKVSAPAREDTTLLNSFTVYFVRYNNVWDAIEERTGLSVRPPQVDLRLATYEEAYNTVAEFKEVIYTALVNGLQVEKLPTLLEAKRLVEEAKANDGIH